MTPGVAGTAFRVFALTLASRLVPGVSTALAARLAVAGRVRRAMELLAVVTGVDLLLFLFLAAGPGREMIVRLGHLAARYQRGALIVLGLVILARSSLQALSGPSVSAELERYPDSPVLMGLAAAVFYPGRWMWWASFGLTVCGLVSRGGSGLLLVGFLSFLSALLAVNVLAVVSARWAGVLGSPHRRVLEVASGLLLLLFGFIGPLDP